MNDPFAGVNPQDAASLLARRQHESRPFLPTQAGLRSGWAQVTNIDDAADGKYLITEKVWDQTEETGKGGLITRPAGYVDAEAYEVDLRDNLAVGDTVRYCQTRDKTGAMKLLLWAGGSGSSDLPYAILPADPSTESELAETDTWFRNDPPGTPPARGLTIKVHTRTAYNETGDQNIYGYYRVMTFDSKGMLVSVSSETRYSIDIPQVCA